MKWYSWLFLPILSCFLLAGSIHAEDAAGTGSWKTAFYKRGFCGQMKIAWSGSPDSSLRVPVPLAMAGSKIRVHLQSSYKGDANLLKLVLIKGSDTNGNVEGPSYPVLFSGSPGVEIKEKTKDLVSDEMEVPVTPGIWYLQQTYTGPECLYAYDSDGYFAVNEDKPEPRHVKGSWAGNISRVDVFTGSVTGVTACYGDSITQGAGVTALSGNRYPSLLSANLKVPVLNMGVNGDLAALSRGMPGMVQSLDGVERVVFLMGINDIISGKFTKVDEYIAAITPVLESVKNNKRKIYIGTVLPAGGYEKFDADPAKEALRQEINAWIRGQKIADGIVDFDEALRDRANPAKLQDAYQSDHLHPSDAGYRKMAEVASAVLLK